VHRFLAAVAALQEKEMLMPNYVRALAAILPLTALLSGCLYEVTIDAKGGAEIKLNYRVDPNMVEKAGKDLQSPDVKLVSKSVDRDHYIDATLQVADVTKLSTTPYFRATTITLVNGSAPGTKTLTVQYVNKAINVNLPPSSLKYYGNEIKVVLHLPGDVVKSNATETKGASATWVVDVTKFFATKETTFEVTYNLPK
jgi:hypothetical protein